MRPQPIREIAPPAWPLPLISNRRVVRVGPLDLGVLLAKNGFVTSRFPRPHRRGRIETIETRLS